MSHTQSMGARSGSTAALSMVNIDSADPARLARSSVAGLGREVTYGDDGCRKVEGDGIKIGSGKFEALRPARWPDGAGAERLHLDLQVGGLDEAGVRLRARGASRPDMQAGTGRRQVLLDPDGRPSCPGPRHAATP